MKPWKEYPLSGANAVLFDVGEPTEAQLRTVEQARDRLDVRIVHHDVGGVVRGASPAESEVDEIIERWIGEARAIDTISRETLRDHASMLSAFLRVLEQEGARALAVNCGAMPEQGLVYPCVPMFELYRNGVIPACEADLHAMLTMMLLTHLAARPAFMGNVFRGPSDILEVEHCVAPRGLLDGLWGYELTGRHGDHHEATAAVDLPEGGPATLARISPDLSHVHYVVGVVSGSHHAGHCRNTVRVRIPEVDAFLGKRLGKVVYGQGHYVLVCADVEDRLLSWAGERGHQARLRHNMGHEPALGSPYN